MRRPCAIVVLLLALLPLGLAAPASAKGPDRVRISGPGLDWVWVLPEGRRGVDAWQLMEASRLFQIWGSARGGERPDLTDRQLGPAYPLTWYVQDIRITTTVAYPFARGGAWVTTTDGMEDWIRVAPRLRHLLVRLGATREDADAAPTAFTDSGVLTIAAAATSLRSVAAVVAWWLRA